MHKFKSVDSLRRVQRIAVVFIFALISAPAFAAVPTATDVSISGTPALGELLTGEYTYDDVDGDSEGTSTFRWLRDGAEIATSEDYTVVAADQGTTLIFEVTPIALAGDNPGLAVQSPGVDVAPNAVPTATAVSIGGIPALGELLTGEYTYDDVDGDSEGTSTFRWLRDGAEIATSEDYTVVAADQGTSLVFEVTPIAASGANPGAAVPSTGVSVTANAVPTATAVSISGTPALGELLTGEYTYDDVDGDSEGTSTFRWLRDGAEIATSEDYTVVAADQGTTLVFEVTPIAASGANPGAAVPSTGVSVTANAVPTATAVSISGTPALGELLTGEYTYDDVDGDSEGTSTFRWLRDGAEIATSEDYTVVAADQGTSLVFEVTPIAASGANPGAAVPSTGVSVTANAVPTATAVSISGTPALGELLTGEYTYDDVDGDSEGTSTFRWLRDGAEIATSEDYTVVAADQGTSLVFEVTPIAASGANPGAAVPSTGVSVTANAVPTATAVSISGTPALGELLTGEYTYDDVDGDSEGTSTFRWLRDGAEIATSEDYTVVAADQGTSLVFEVTPIAASGANPGAAVPSTGVSVTANAVPTATAVSISGTPALGELLTGEYTYDDVDGDSEGTSTFRWLRDGAEIATSEDYTVVAADQGTSLVFEVTPIAASGANPGAAVPSTGVSVTANAVPTATAVSISGTPALGELLTGEYTYDDVDGDSEGTSTFRWLRDGAEIATSEDYTVVAADQGTSLVFEVTPIAASGANPGAAVPSTGVSVTANAVPTATAVSISGTPALGELLTGEYTYDDVDGDSEGTSTFRWLRDGAEIATSEDYTVVAADQGTSLVFEVTPIAASGANPGAAVPSSGVDVAPNVAPVLTVPALPATIDELVAFGFMATATDADGDGTTFRLDDGAAGSVPAGAAITTAGVFSWTPTEAQGPNSYTFDVVVTDDGAGLLSASETITITVNEVDAAPILTLPPLPINIDELAAFEFTATATDADLPADTLTFSLDSGTPAGASINASTGLFSWTPSEAQGPGDYQFDVVVKDGKGNNGNEDRQTINVTVDEVNNDVAPVLDVPRLPNKIDELAAFEFTATATDADLPADTLTFSLDTGTPAGASINASTGLFSWTPSEAQGPGDYQFDVVVTDSTANEDRQTVNVTVDEVNNNTPVLDPIVFTSPIDEGGTLTFTANANDADLPADTLTYSLDAGAPAGAAINASTGLFSWTPSEAQGPGDFNITVRVSDAGSNEDFETIAVNVSEVNVAPVLAGIGNQTVDEGTTVSFTASASDVDLPANTLTFSLDAGAPAGATINQTTGQFSWITTEADGPGSFPVTVRVTDNGSPNLDVFESISITVNEVNEAPVANDIEFNVVEGGSALASFNVLSNDTDPDSASPVLTAELVGAGPTLNPSLFALNSNGTFSYTHDGSETSSDSFDYRACDDGEPRLCSSAATVTITVDNVNDAPEIGGQQPVSTDEETPRPITLTDLVVSDVDSATADFILSVQAGTDYTLDGDTITPVLDFNGDLTVPVTVSDGTDTSDVFNLVVNVTPVNDQPVITGQNVTTTPEATERAITLNDLIVTDPDNEFPAEFTLAIQDGEDYTRVANTITPATDFNGDLTVPLTVTDSSGEGNATSAVFNLTVSVSAVNNQPVITEQLPLSTEEDTSLTLAVTDLTIVDADSTFPDDFTLTIQDGSDYTSVNNTITPALDFNGELTVPVTVNDGEADSAVFNVIVTVTPVNDVPVIIDQADLTTPEDASLTVLITDLTVFDPDIDTVFPDDFTLELLDGANYTLSDNTITPDLNFNGLLSVPATVSDFESTSAQFLLTIDVSAENDQPVLETPIEDPDNPIFAIEGDPFLLDISGNFSDADGDELQFTASGLPLSGNLNFNTSTGVFSGTPRFEDARDDDPYIIVVTATDGDPDTTPAEDIFELNISALDRANVSLEISVAPDPAMLNDELQWTFTVRNTLGPQPANNVALTGSFVGTGLNISSTSSCSIAGILAFEGDVGEVSEFECTLGSLPVGGSTTVILTTVTSEPGDVVAFGSAASTDPLPLDPNLADNSRQIAVGVAEAFSNGVVQVLGRAEILSVAAGDINGDGIVDLVAGTEAGRAIQIYLGDGFRGFAAASISLPDNAANVGVALADFDGNGTLDVVAANGGGQADVVYSNDGVGNFTPMATLGLTFSQDVAVGDFNNDGATDIVVATIQGNPVYLGDGFGGFVLQATLGNANSQAVAVADFNGDGRDDIVFANVSSDSQIWIKNIGGGFSKGSSLPIGDAASVTVGEFGGNARPDLAFGRISSGAGDVPSNPVLINDGSGGFAAPLVLLGTSRTTDIHAGDVNSDGLTDLVFINVSGVHQIWTATGTGFTLHREQIVDMDSTVGVLTELGMTDMDDPGGVDLAVGGAVAAGLGIYLNDGFGNLGMGDAVPPVLALVGEANVTVPAGSVYTDSGANAEDNIDGDISTSVVASGVVDTAVVGSYTVTYNVIDRAGNNAASITRTVTVSPAAGTGGGGGGAIGWMLLLLLIFVACLSAYHANRAILSAGIEKQNKQGRENA